MAEIVKKIFNLGVTSNGVEDVEIVSMGVMAKILYKHGWDYNITEIINFHAVAKMVFENIKTTKKISFDTTEMFYELSDSRMLLEMRATWPKSAIWPSKEKVRHFVFSSCYWGVVDIIAERYTVDRVVDG